MTFVDERDPARHPAAPGFTTVCGQADGLARLSVVRGLLPAGDRGWVHAHGGDELIRVLDGELLLRVGGEWRRCGPGETAVVPLDTLHGFVVAGTDAVVEVVHEQRMGSWFPARAADGTVELVEVHRAGVPFDRDPPPGRGHTTGAEVLRLVAATTEPLEPPGS